MEPITKENKAVPAEVEPRTVGVLIVGTLKTSAQSLWWMYMPSVGVRHGSWKAGNSDVNTSSM